MDEAGRTASALWLSSPGVLRGLHAPRKLCSPQYTRPYGQTSCHGLLCPRLRGDEHRRGARADGPCRPALYQTEKSVRGYCLSVIILRVFRCSSLAPRDGRYGWHGRRSSPRPPQHMDPRRYDGQSYRRYDARDTALATRLLAGASASLVARLAEGEGGPQVRTNLAPPGVRPRRWPGGGPRQGARTSPCPPLLLTLLVKPKMHGRAVLHPTWEGRRIEYILLATRPALALRVHHCD